SLPRVFGVIRASSAEFGYGDQRDGAYLAGASQSLTPWKTTLQISLDFIFALRSRECCELFHSRVISWLTTESLMGTFPCSAQASDEHPDQRLPHLNHRAPLEPTAAASLQPLPIGACLACPESPAARDFHAGSW